MESLPVPSVQAMVAATGGDDVPPRYLRPGRRMRSPATARPRSPSSIMGSCCWRDMARSLHGSTGSARTGASSSVMEGMKANIRQFFQLPAETKKQFAQERGQLEGYGQLFVVSEDQKLDWADILYLNTQPPEDRSMRFWPDKPAKFRSTLDKYSTTVKGIADSLVATMARNLGLKPATIADKCVVGIQSVRMNYYPPCAQADKVVGFFPHSDSDLLTLVLQVNHVQGLQIKRNGSWFPVKPVEAHSSSTSAIYLRSIEHRAVIDPREERLSVAAFHSPSIHATIGPLKEIAAHKDEAYKTVDHEEFMKLFFSTKLEGKSFLDRMKLRAQVDYVVWLFQLSNIA